MLQIMANGIVSISTRSGTCKTVSVPNFDKKRSKSSEKICDEKANRWVRSSSQEYDEVPRDSHQLSRCPSGGTSEAAEAAVNLAMQTLRKHYGDKIPICGIDSHSSSISEYLEQTDQMTMQQKSISSTADNISLTLKKPNIDHLNQKNGKRNAESINKRPSSPSPPPLPPHRTSVLSSSKVIKKTV